MSAVAEQLPAPSPIDGPDLANKRTGWRKFPMVMHHPAFRPAVVSNDRQVDASGRERWVHAPPGKPIQYGPVTVLNEAQEELHLSKGYRSSGDRAAIDRLTIAPPPPGYQFHEYPRMLEDGTIDEGPDAPQPPDNFYPYFVRMEGYEPTRVEDFAEHKELLRKRGVEGPSPPAPEVDPRDAEVADLKARVAELEALMMQSRAPAEVEPAAQVSGEADATHAAILQNDPQAEAELVDGKGEVDPNGPAIVTAIGEAQLEGEPSAEDAIKARLAELDAEEAALEVEEPAEAPAKQRKR